MATRNPLDPIPHPPKTLLLGNLLALGTTTPVQDMIRLARQYGSIYWLDMMGKPVVIVSGFGLVDELCDESRFDKSVRGALRRLRSFAGDGLFTAYTHEPNWAKAHNILLPNFGQRAMQGYHDMMLDVAEQLVLKWERLNAEDAIDVTDDMTRLTLDTIGLCGFGFRFNSFYRDTNHPFVDAMVGALGTSMQTRGLPLESVLHKDRERRLRADIRYMNEVTDRIIQARRQGGGHDARDLLSHMLTGVDKKSGEGLDDLNIRYQILTFLIAGHETTSGLLSFALYFLLQNPGALARARAEVDRVLGSDPSARPTYAQVNRLEYVGQVLKESLRLWPTAPVFALYPHKETVIGGRYRLKRHHQVVVLSPMLHRDSAVWGGDAERFDPDRFTREAESARPANAYKPFGNGQRACIGRQFAMQEAALVLGMILHRFDLVDHAGYQLKLKETLTVKPDGFTIRVRPRAERPRAPREAIAVAGADDAARPAPAAGHRASLVVLYGSNLGTAEELARGLGQEAEGRGFSATVAPLDEYAGRLPRDGVVVIATASYNGAPPDNAGRFCEWARGLGDGDLAGVRYTVFGCGNRDWAATFQAVPRLIDERLAAAGAERVHPRGEGDARDDFDGQFQAWRRPLWPAVAARLGIAVADAPARERVYRVEVVPGTRTSPFVDTLGARPMRVLANRELHEKGGATPSPRSTRHLELELPEGVGYRAGDHLGVIAHNGEAAVARAAARFGLAPETIVRLRRAGSRKPFLPVDQAIAVGTLLADYVELADVATRSQIQVLAEHTECPWTRPRLLALAGDDPGSVERYKADVMAERTSLLDLLEEYPACGLPFDVYLELLAPLAPRYYSISSSPLLHPRAVHVTVAVVEGPARSGRGVHEGVCSTYLRRQAAGDVVYAFVKDTKSAFRLPDDPRVPIVMIGPGTGLAPFRGFVQERAAMKAAGQAVGRALLFFGCRHPEQDFIYADELRALEASGVVALRTAFSRVPGEQKCYVQDRVMAAGDEVWGLLEEGARVYVCGDASRMAPDVRRAFAVLHAAKTGGGAPAAERWLDELAASDRYLVDVWAS